MLDSRFTIQMYISFSRTVYYYYKFNISIVCEWEIGPHTYALIWVFLLFRLTRAIICRCCTEKYRQIIGYKQIQLWRVLSRLVGGRSVCRLLFNKIFIHFFLSLVALFFSIQIEIPKICCRPDPFVSSASQQIHRQCFCNQSGMLKIDRKYKGISLLFYK